MKKIYFKHETQGNESFNYSDISELQDELEKRKIIIADGVSIGKHVTIGNEVIVKEGAIVGNYVTIGNGTRLEKNTIIADNVIVGENVNVGQHTIIRNGAWVGKEVYIEKCVSIGYDTDIKDYAEIGGNVKIGNCVAIGEKAIILKNAIIANNALIGSGVRLERNLHIAGSKHSVTYTGNSSLSIGCHNLTIEQWLDNFRIIGEDEEYTEDEILEYELYIRMVDKLIKQTK